MKVLTASQMREADRLTTERCGIPSLQLMENAGSAVTSYLLNAYPNVPSWRVVVLCGKGNNGGDGMVVARRLRESGASPVVILFAQPADMKGDAAENLRSWQRTHGELRIVTTADEWEQQRPVIDKANLIVDALLGTGLTGPVEGLLATVIEAVNELAGKRSQAGGVRAPRVVSVDMPSGLASGAEDFAGPVIWAEATVTFTAPKIGQMISPRAECVGKLVVRQIGTPPSILNEVVGAHHSDQSSPVDLDHPAAPPLNLTWIEPCEFRGLPMVRNRDSNKGNFGHALIIAGSFGKSGAAALCGRAALRVGAGLVTVAIPKSVLPTVASSMPELMTVPLAETEAGTASMANLDYGHFGELVRGKSVLAAGPGLSTNDETQQYIRAMVAGPITGPISGPSGGPIAASHITGSGMPGAEAPGADVPLILDADALNAYVGWTAEFTARKSTLLAMTPHPGEMGRLLGISAAEVQARRLEIALETASRWNAHVVLKGFHTILATPDGRAFINTTGNPGMATGGTGDVLTGILAGLTAEFGTQNWPCVLALGIYLHGLAGDLAAAKVGEAPLVASDLIEFLPQAMEQFIAEWGVARF